MLAAIGVDSVDDLFEQIPAPLRLGRPLELPSGMSEAEVYERLAELAGRNADAESQVCFVGAGMYDHYVPAIVEAITSRSEFLTPYTPYQPEISQGGLQVMFEFQTAMSELTGLPVSNAGLYEGPSSVASAGYLAMGATKRSKFVVSRGLHPHSRETLATYSRGYGSEVVEVGLEGGVTDAAALAAAVDGETAAVFLQSPNFLGAVEDVEALGAAAKEHGALLVVACDPMTLGILKPPGESGADIALGEGQPLGNRLDFGGPSFGFFCATEAQIRRMPGGRRRAARLRPRAADARAAHPPREGDQQHLHRAGAERARCDGPPGLARPRGLPRAGRAAGAAHRLRARAAGRGRGGRAAPRRPGRPRVRGEAGRAGRRGARPGRRARDRGGLPARP
jgi:glycine dehydrogenase subunit 1